jgi:hypothetical protein
MNVLDTQSQRKYRSGVGILLYLTNILNQISVILFENYQKVWIQEHGELTMNF